MAEPATVAVVEDDPDVRDLHRLWLRDDHEVDAIPDGTTALRRIETQDVVLLDRRLPGPDGDAVVQGLHADGYRGGIAMVTSERPEPAVATLPVDEYVTKPVGGAQLRSLVDRLQTRRTMDDGIRDLLAMLSRRARLEAVHGRPKLVDCEAYQTLADRIEHQYDRVLETGVPPERITSLAADGLDPSVDLAELLGGPSGERRSTELGDRSKQIH